MANCVITGTILDPSAAAISGATIRVRLVTANLNGGTSLLVPKELNTTTDTSGVFTLTLQQGLSVIVTVEYPPNSTDNNRRLEYSMLVPATTTAIFGNLITEL